MKEIDELKAKMAEFQRKLDAFDTDIERAKDVLCMKPAEWPQVGDEYWSGAGDFMCAKSYIYKAIKGSAFAKAVGDVHRTKEEAEAYRAYRMNPRTVMRDNIQMFVDEYNGGARGSYFFAPNGIGGWTIVVKSGANPMAVKDYAGAELLVEKFGLDNILWACGGRNPSDSDGPAPGGDE